MVAEAHGATITDVDGNVFVDFTGGVGCLNVGHSSGARRRGGDRAARALHAHGFHVVPYESYVALAERLVGLVPISGQVRAAFFNSGAEAIENAVKIARSYTGRPAVIAFDGGFHGRTLMAMSLTSKTHPYKAGLGRSRPRSTACRFRTPYRGPDALAALAELERALSLRVAAEEVAAIVFEPVQGEGGFVVAPEEFVRGLRRICDEHGIVLVADEVQTGFGRTGRLFAMEHYGVEPDLMTVAKSIAGGLPLSGVLGRAELMNAPPDSAIGGTFPGNPVACAAGLAVLDLIEEEGLVDRAETAGRRDPLPYGALAAIASRRSAMSAAWARCSPSSSSPIGRRESRHPGLRPRSSTLRSSGACCCSRPASTETAFASSCRS